MGRHPIGDRPMTVTERHRKWLAAKVANTSKLVAVPTPPAPPPFGSYITLKQIRDYPKLAALELYDRIGRDHTVALRDALSWAIEKKAG